MTEFKTPAGKVIETYVCPTTAHLKVRFANGGELPHELSGVFTSKALADIAITSYLLRNATKQVQEVKKKEEKKAFVKEMTKKEVVSKDD